MADEAEFLQLLISNERISRDLDILCDPYQRNKYDACCIIICRSSRAHQPLLHTAAWSAVAAVAAAAGQQFGLASVCTSALCTWLVQLCQRFDFVGVQAPACHQPTAAGPAARGIICGRGNPVPWCATAAGPLVLVSISPQPAPATIHVYQGLCLSCRPTGWVQSRS